MVYHIRLTKARSYRGVVTATKAQPDVYVEDKAIADKAVASGYFTLVEVTEDEAGDTDAEDGGAEDEEQVDYEKLEAMTKAELTEYAEERGISLEGCSTKAQILKAISTANGGSAAMIDLQQ